MDSMPDTQVQQGGTLPLLNIVGEKVALGPAHRDLLPLLNTWDNDFTTFFLGGNILRPITAGGTETFLAATLKGEAQGQIFFIIYEYASLRPIGWTILRHISCSTQSHTMNEPFALIPVPAFVLLGDADKRSVGAINATIVCSWIACLQSLKRLSSVS